MISVSRPASATPPRTRAADVAVIAVDLVDGQARASVLETSSWLRPRLIDVNGPRIRIALVAVCASVLAGDHLHIDVQVGAGVTLELQEPTATVAYNARGGTATWRAQVRVEPDGSFVWRTAPFVVADGADIHRHTEVDLAAGARALIGETVVLGRAHEDGGDLVNSTRAIHDGQELLVEELDLRSTEMRALPGVLQEARVLATLCLFGVPDVAVTPPHETALHGPGALARWLAPQAHQTESGLDHTWQQWIGFVDADG